MKKSIQIFRWTMQIDRFHLQPSGWIYFSCLEHIIGNISNNNFISIQRACGATWKHFTSIERFWWEKEALLISHLVKNGINQTGELMKATRTLQEYIQEYSDVPDLSEFVVNRCLKLCWKIRLE